MFHQFLSYICKIFLLHFNIVIVQLIIRQYVAYVARIQSTSLYIYIYALIKKDTVMQLDNITNKCDWWRRLHPQSFCTAGTNVCIWQTSLSHSYDHLHFPPNTAGRGLFITHMKTKYHWTLRMLLLLPQEVSLCMSMHASRRKLSHSFSQLWSKLQWDSTVISTLFTSSVWSQLCYRNYLIFFFLQTKITLQSILENF